MALNVNAASCDEQIKARDYFWCVLHCLIDVDHPAASTRIVFKIALEL
jgi:hypothetical protein